MTPDDVRKRAYGMPEPNNTREMLLALADVYELAEDAPRPALMAALRRVRELEP